MIALTIQSSLNELVAFALTYLLHSTTWILLVLCLIKVPLFNTSLLRNYLWKGALIGGLLTSLIIHFSGNSLLTIPLAEEVVVQSTVKQQPTTTALKIDEVLHEVVPIENADLIILIVTDCGETKRSH